MDRNSPASAEEIWFARIVVILGAKELVDVFLNLASILKIRSGLPIIVNPSEMMERVAAAYVVSELIVGIYLVCGGQLLSRLAFGRPVARAILFDAADLRIDRSWLGVAFRAFGVNQLILGCGYIAQLASYGLYAHGPLSPNGPNVLAVDLGWMLEHFVLGLVLVSFGGAIASRILPRHQPSES
jgi:hypothetical protein